MPKQPEQPGRGSFRRVPGILYDWEYFLNHRMVAQYHRMCRGRYSVTYHRDGNAVAYACFAVNSEREARALCRCQDHGPVDVLDTVTTARDFSVLALNNLDLATLKTAKHYIRGIGPGAWLDEMPKEAPPPGYTYDVDLNLVKQEKTP